MSDCKGIWGKLFGHNFHSRYDTKNTLPKSTTWEVSVLTHGDLPRSQTITYVHDVCTRCGEVLRRPDEKKETT